MKKTFNINALRTIAVIILLAGAAGSLGLTIYTGRNNKSIVLVLLFVIWVLSPFVGLFAAGRRSKNWSAITRITLYCLIIVIALGSFIIYTGVFSPSDIKPAALFLITPLISWILLSIVIVLAAFLRERANRNDSF